MRNMQKHLEQYLSHDIEDEEKAEEYLNGLLPLIGQVVMNFNGLESELDSLICEIISDRTDSFGLIVLHKMNYSTKVDLLGRFCDEFGRHFTSENEHYQDLISRLKAAGRLRNNVVHADWESTNEEGFTYVKLNINKKDGIMQEYVQFSEESLEQIIELIRKVRIQLDNYWERRDEILSSW